jgi:hypothetical protein
MSNAQLDYTALWTAGAVLSALLFLSMISYLTERFVISSPPYQGAVSDHFDGKKFFTPGVAFDDLPPIDVVLVSHNHYDHCDCAHDAQSESNVTPFLFFVFNFYYATNCSYYGGRLWRALLASFASHEAKTTFESYFAG